MIVLGFTRHIFGVAGLSHTSKEQRSVETGSNVAQKPTPLQRVVTLLQDMKAQLEKEAMKDSEAYDKMVCWCTTNEKEKTTAIADADALDNELVAQVEMLSAGNAALGTNIAKMKEDLAKMKSALATATAIREKELAEFNSKEKEMVQAITMLKNAILVLKRHNAGLLQLSPAVQASMGSAMRWIALKHEEMTEMQMEGLTMVDKPDARQRAALISLRTRGGNLHGSASTGSSFENSILKALQTHRSMKQDIPTHFAARVLANEAARSASFAQQPVYQSYAPQSGQIFGILTQMQEEFEASLSADQKREVQAQEDFSALKSSMEAQIDASAKMLDENEERLAADTKALSDAKENLDITRKTRSADVKFLRNLKLKCQEFDHEWKIRSKARAEEIQAVSETVAILTEDEARDLFNEKLGTGGAFFLQLREVRSQQLEQRRKAAALLHKAAQRLKAQQIPDGENSFSAWKSTEETPHQQLSAVAMQVQLDGFAKVKKAIADMVEELKKQQEDEVKKKTYCSDELHNSAKSIYTTKKEIEDIQDKISSLKDTIEKLAEEIATAKKEIETTNVEIKKASELRKQENLNFQEEVMDQRAMQNILAKAKDRMEQVYNKNAFVQQDPNPPVQLQPYKQNKGGSKVVSFLEAIIEDSKALEKDATAAEQEAQMAYQSFVNDSNESIKTLNEAIESKTDAKTTAEADKEEALNQLSSTTENLENLEEAAGDLHKECDFVLKNFDIRQSARLEEIEALKEASAYLSGMQGSN